MWQNTFAKRRVLDVVLALLLIGGLGTLALLNAQALHARRVAESSISELSAKSDELGDRGRIEVKRQALAFNARLAGRESEAAILPYEEQLLFDREPMMSYIEIPKINVRLPIYHGTSEAALMAGVGHLESSSLPVGGQDAHCVLAAHSGMRNAHMFDELDQLVAGDTFVIWTLSEPYAYRVTNTEIVEPDEVSSLGIDPDHDLCTLVTCTPYGVNSHRLLVHAARCSYEPDEQPQPTVHLGNREQSLVGALALVAVAPVAVFAAKALSRRKKKRTYILRSTGRKRLKPQRPWN